MSDEFKVIETQEQFNEAISERLKRERETVEKKFAGYISPEEAAKKSEELNTKIAELNKTIESEKEAKSKLNAQITELQGKNKEYETASVKSRIAHETGLPYEAIAFLSGDDEESIQKNANALKGLMGQQGGGLPLASTETNNMKDEKSEEMKTLLKNLRGEN